MAQNIYRQRMERKKCCHRCRRLSRYGMNTGPFLTCKRINGDKHGQHRAPIQGSKTSKCHTHTHIHTHAHASMDPDSIYFLRNNFPFSPTAVCHSHSTIRSVCSVIFGRLSLMLHQRDMISRKIRTMTQRVCARTHAVHISSWYNLVSDGLNWMRQQRQLSQHPKWIDTVLCERTTYIHSLSSRASLIVSSDRVVIVFSRICRNQIAKEAGERAPAKNLEENQAQHSAAGTKPMPGATEMKWTNAYWLCSTVLRAFSYGGSSIVHIVSWAGLAHSVFLQAPTSMTVNYI